MSARTDGGASYTCVDTATCQRRAQEIKRLKAELAAAQAHEAALLADSQDVAGLVDWLKQDIEVDEERFFYRSVDQKRAIISALLSQQAQIQAKEAELAAANEEIATLRSEWRIQNAAIADQHDALASARKELSETRMTAADNILEVGERLKKVEAELARLQAIVGSHEFSKECANTPLMRDVMGSRDALKTKLAAAQSKLREVCEIYTGMDGFIPETAPEGYQQRILRQMYEAAREEPAQ